ncbi:MAG: O-antigen ligase family protein [Mobilitalea sp.]
MPMILLIIIKITSLLYSTNYLRGIGVIEWFIENLFFAVVCYIYYVKGVIGPSKIMLFIVAGFVLSISVALIQIGNVFLNSNFLVPLIDYVNSNTPDVNLFAITGLYMGDTNSYATYVAAVLLTFIALLVYSKKYLLGTAILFSIGTPVLFSLESRSSIMIFILLLIYMVIRAKIMLKKQAYLLMLLIFLSLLSIIITLPSNTSDAFFQKYSYRYLRLINYINSIDDEEEANFQSHKNMLIVHLDNIDREPFAAITGVGEGDYLNIGGGSEKKETGAHNAYILILGENGPIAFLIFVYITWLILKASFFVNRNSPIPMAKSFLYFNIAYLLSFVLYGSQIHECIFWGMIGITFAEKTRIVMNRHIDIRF